MLVQSYIKNIKSIKCCIIIICMCLCEFRTLSKSEICSRSILNAIHPIDIYWLCFIFCNLLPWMFKSSTSSLTRKYLTQGYTPQWRDHMDPFPDLQMESKRFFSSLICISIVAKTDFLQQKCMSIPRACAVLLIHLILSSLHQILLFLEFLSQFSVESL